MSAHEPLPAMIKTERNNVSGEEIITRHMDVWIGAVTNKSSSGRGNNKKVELTGINTLRELILELAVRGKLVEKNPTDEPARLLLERARAEKLSLIKRGEIKKRRRLTELSEMTIPFDIPTNWEWTQLEDIGRDWGQKTPSSDFSYIDVASVDNHRGVTTQPSILSADEAPSRARKVVRRGTMIYSTVRPYLQNIAIVDSEIEPEPIASTAFAILHPLSKMSARFFFHYLRSPTFVKYVETVQTGIAYPAINDKQFFSGLVPVPPLEEQHRIVQKVDKLMDLCDRLEQHTNDQLEAHETLVDTLLSTLTQSENATELADNWARLSAHFDTLLTTEQSVDKLKQTILQLAVMGLLVKPTTSSQESIESLLQSLNSERLLGNPGGKSKRTTLSSSGAHGLRHSIPKHWAWVKFGETWISSFYGPRFAKQDYVKSGGIPTVRTTDMDGKGNISLVKAPLVLVPENKRELYLLAKNDILVTRSGSIGVTALYDLDIPAIPSAYLIRLRLCPSINPQYVLMYLNSPLGQKSLGIYSTAVGVPNVSASKMSSFDFPLPPLEEQHRIVHNVDELMALCDHLKERLNQASEIRCQLAEAVVEGALS